MGGVPSEHCFHEQTRVRSQVVSSKIEILCSKRFDEAIEIRPRKL
jgi:hypothetical protein